MGIISKAKRVVAATLVSIMAVGGIAPSVALADSSRMVTLGADLSESERANVLSFFNLTEGDLSQMEVITVNNQDERRYLEGTLSDDIIGYKTYSCSYIEPRTSGGLRVETANLTYVTKNTLYNALQTAGVENASLVVTAPFPVSGTGALTGVFMAYEERGVALDEEKKDAATEELVATAALEEEYGEGVAEVISDVKNEAISQGGELSDEEIRSLIKTAAKLKGIDLTDEDIDVILGLVQKVQGLDYDLDAFSNTLDEFKAALDGATAKAEEAKGFFERIGDWFQGIIDWFKGLFGMLPDNGASDVAEDDDLIGDLNTDVFALDGTEEEAEADDVASEEDGQSEEEPVIAQEESVADDGDVATVDEVAVEDASDVPADTDTDGGEAQEAPAE